MPTDFSTATENQRPPLAVVGSQISQDEELFGRVFDSWVVSRVLVYLRPEVMGDGVLDRLLKIQRPLEDDVNAPDLTRVDGIGSSPRTPAWREIGTGCQILRSLGISSMRVLTNNPMPLAGIQGYGLDVVDHIPIEVTPADLQRV